MKNKKKFVFMSVFAGGMELTVYAYNEKHAKQIVASITTFHMFKLMNQ